MAVDAIAIARSRRIVPLLASERVYGVARCESNERTSRVGGVVVWEWGVGGGEWELELTGIVPTEVHSATHTPCPTSASLSVRTNQEYE
jgi:hypothetical protein